MKLAMTATAITLSFMEGGMMMAMNMPYSATERALEMLPGKRLPSQMPRRLPSPQRGMDISIAP